MTYRHYLSVLACGFSLSVSACGGGMPPAADTSAPAAATSAAGAAVRAELIKDWESQKATLVAIADAMPEDKFGFKSTPEQRSYGEQIMHVATVNVGMLKVVGGTVPPPSFTAESATTKAEIVQALGESYDYALALLNEQTDASITEAVDAGFLGSSTRARVFWFLLGHSMDIYGQMAVYLRLNGIVPPASRGV